jgi:hypothetical protein
MQRKQAAIHKRMKILWTRKGHSKQLALIYMLRSLRWQLLVGLVAQQPDPIWKYLGLCHEPVLCRVSYWVQIGSAFS